jgi:hypothetical protein
MPALRGSDTEALVYAGRRGMNAWLLVHKMPWWRSLGELVVYGSPMVKLTFGVFLFACGMFAGAGVHYLWRRIQRRRG